MKTLWKRNVCKGGFYQKNIKWNWCVFLRLGFIFKTRKTNIPKLSRFSDVPEFKNYDTLIRILFVLFKQFSNVEIYFKTSSLWVILIFTFIISMHWVPFWHGFVEHSLISVPQFWLKNPFAHSQIYAEFQFWLIVPFQQNWETQYFSDFSQNGP